MDEKAMLDGDPQDVERITTAETASIAPSIIPMEKNEKHETVVRTLSSDQPEPATNAPPTFPDGGWRAWLVIAGVAALNFAT